MTTVLIILDVWLFMMAIVVEIIARAPEMPDDGR